MSVTLAPVLHGALTAALHLHSVLVNNPQIADLLYNLLNSLLQRAAEEIADALCERIKRSWLCSKGED